MVHICNTTSSISSQTLGAPEKLFQAMISWFFDSLLSNMRHIGYLLGMLGAKLPKIWKVRCIIKNNLRAEFFRGIKHKFTFYVNPPHLHDTGSWNHPFSKAIYLFYIVNIMGADVLATQGPGHQHTWYLLCWTGMIRLPHVKGPLSMSVLVVSSGWKYHCNGCCMNHDHVCDLNM